jgi:hypothetical protein
MVFNQEIIYSSEPKKVRESSFSFLERSSWNRCRMVRELVNLWVDLMNPDTEFLSKLRSKKDKQHAAAMFELIVFTFLRKADYGVQIHPPVPKSTTPDFHVTGKGINVYMECTLCGNSFESAENKRRMESVEDIVSQIQNYAYFINLGFKSISAISLTPRKFRRFIDQVREASEGIDNKELFHRRYLYEESGWRIEVSLLRKSSQKIKTSLGYISQDAKAISSEKTIISALNDKRPSKYGIFDMPYVICICVNDMFFHIEEMDKILFGTDSGTYIDLSHARNGGFFFHSSPINTSVSAIFLFKSTDLITIGSSEWSIWHNPFANCPLTVNQFPVKEYYFEKQGNRLLKKETQNESSIFDLLCIDQNHYETDPKGTKAY